VTHACNPIYSGGKIKRISVQSQPRQIVQGTLSQKKSFAKRAGGVAQGVGPEFRPQCQQKTKRKNPWATQGEPVFNKTKQKQINEKTSCVHELKVLLLRCQR
jgi:hypothetical protein